MDIATIQKLNKFWQEKFDRKHPRKARQRQAREGELPKMGDVCQKCFRIIDASTHAYSDLGGFECLHGEPRTGKKSRSKRSRIPIYKH